MKITDKHRFILGKVRLISMPKQHLDGATMDEIVGVDNCEKMVKAMVKAGYLEEIRTPPGERLSTSGMTRYDCRGFTLFRVGPKGADLMVKEAFEYENSKSLLERMASHLKGIPTEYVRQANHPKCVRKGFHDELANVVMMS